MTTLENKSPGAANPGAFLCSDAETLDGTNSIGISASLQRLDSVAEGLLSKLAAKYQLGINRARTLAALAELRGIAE